MPVDIAAYSYAAAIAVGGVIGYVKSASIPSLGAGLLFGSILGYGAYQVSEDPTNIGVFLGASTTLGGMMGYRYYNSGKFMPGIIALFSIAMMYRTVNRYFVKTSMKT